MITLWAAFLLGIYTADKVEVEIVKDARSYWEEV